MYDATPNLWGSCPYIARGGACRYGGEGGGVPWGSIVKGGPFSNKAGKPFQRDPPSDPVTGRPVAGYLDFCPWGVGDYTNAAAIRQGVMVSPRCPLPAHSSVSALRPSPSISFSPSGCALASIRAPPFSRPCALLPAGLHPRAHARARLQPGPLRHVAGRQWQPTEYFLLHWCAPARF